MKPLFSTASLVYALLIVLAGIGIPQGALYYANLVREYSHPIPALQLGDYADDQAAPVLATVFWLRPGEHVNASVVITAMFNTPGAEGVRVYVDGGDYELRTPILLKDNDWIVATHQAMFTVDIPLEQNAMWLQGSGERLDGLNLFSGDNNDAGTMILVGAK